MINYRTIQAQKFLLYIAMLGAQNANKKTNQPSTID